jgi:hypothetical protein
MKPGARTLVIVCLAAVSGCRADVWMESPDERLAAAEDTARSGSTVTVVDTVFRPMPIDSAGASFVWLTRRPDPLVPWVRTFPDDAVEAVEQFLRALAQTGSSSRGRIGVGDIGYERAFTYVHPQVRGRRSWRQWAPALEGIVRPVAIQLRRVPQDSSRVFVELLVLREVDGESFLGLYYGHFAAAPGDNGWQLTGARFVSEDWQSPLGDLERWRYDRAGAARSYADEDPAYSFDLVHLESGEWVPLTRSAPSADLRLGLPDLP